MEGSFVLCGAYVMEEDGGFSDPRDVLVEGGIIRAITSSGRLPRDAVIDDVINDLMETYNWSEEMATQMVVSGGLEIYTWATALPPAL